MEAARLRTENGVVISKIGGAYLYIFTGGEPIGSVHAGNTVQVDYWLHVSGRPRFISMDATMAGQKFKPSIYPGKSNQPANWSGGFYILSSKQGKLDVVISQRLWEKIADQPTRDRVKALQQAMSREANLNVTIERVKKEYRIKSVIIE